MFSDEKIQHKLLIISHDVIGHTMAGPGIRYFHLARTLAKYLPTTLAIPRLPNGNRDVIEAQTEAKVVEYEPDDWQTVLSLLLDTNICFLPGDLTEVLSNIAELPLYVIIDGYDPLSAELLMMAMQLDETERPDFWNFYAQRLRPQYRIGDFYVCASERQRDRWLGLLESHGRVNPSTYQFDPSLRKLVDVVPYALVDKEITDYQPVIKGRWNGIGVDTKLILWGGGLWTWLDPLTAIRAVARIWEYRHDVRLVFPGTKHPNPKLASAPTHEVAAKQLAQELGLLDKVIFFGDWIPYRIWDSVLMESDIALSLHFDTLETHFAFRSRMLEYIRASLPIIATRGDVTGDLVAKYDIGTLVGCEAVDEVFVAMMSLLDGRKDSYTERFRKAQEDLTWEKAVVPVLAYCSEPYRAADRHQNQSGTVYSPSNSEESQLRQLKLQIEIQRNLIEGYERGKFIRAMRWLQNFRKNSQKAMKDRSNEQ